MLLRKPLIALGLCAGLGFATAAWGQTPNLTALYDALNLTPSQESAWTAYKASVAAPDMAQQRRRAAMALFPTLTAPRRMYLVEAEMRQDLADLHRQAESLSSFYATLDPVQRRVFDAQTLPSATDRDDDR
jgi:hypothetical protein